MKKHGIDWPEWVTQDDGETTFVQHFVPSEDFGAVSDYQGRFLTKDLPAELTVEALRGLTPYWNTHQFAGAPRYLGTPTHYANGKFRFINHGRNDFGVQSCIPDMACKDLRNEWPDYVVERDASGNITREGPKPFATKEEMDSYCKLAGMVVGGYDSRPSDAYQSPLGKLSPVDDVPQEFDASSFDPELSR